MQSRASLERYGFRGWIPPDSGQDEQPAHFGGGDTNYDAEYAEQAADFLRRVDRRFPRPFALIVSFANPHDIMAHPSLWNAPSKSDIPPFKGSDNYGKDAPGCFNQGIDLPPQPTLDEDLAGNFKPKAHAQSLGVFDTRLGKLDTTELKLEYVNFYAYLHKLTDDHIGTVLDALEDDPDLHAETLVIRLADHGEMGLSHGGLRQKTYNAYEETIHVPLVISNPRMFPGPVKTGALASLIDVMPTIATLADVPNRDTWYFVGRDLSPIIQDAIDHPDTPTAAVQDSVLFTSDEPSQALTPPFHVRCLREARWKFVMYVDPNDPQARQFELYDLVDDPMELRNMAHPESPYYDAAKTEEMRAKLTAKLEEARVDEA